MQKPEGKAESTGREQLQTPRHERATSAPRARHHQSRSRSHSPETGRGGEEGPTVSQAHLWVRVWEKPGVRKVAGATCHSNSVQPDLRFGPTRALRVHRSCCAAHFSFGVFRRFSRIPSALSGFPPATAVPTGGTWRRLPSAASSAPVGAPPSLAGDAGTFNRPHRSSDASLAASACLQSCGCPSVPTAS